MKRLLLCLVIIISMVMLRGGTGTAASNIDAGVLDPCKWPGGPHPGCNPDAKVLPPKTNKYQRACYKESHCRP
ncbi:hypothetical protein I3843_14G041800 [Carya illinoinensis]|uniref:Rapid ALkalinization Factor n=1 Tax=Carya illinoinensis TaxID=32201 RepID=A0A8T1NGK2_CARIL|nr:hypothetical protein I3760_14G042300 [Carya illinoinensis]KAG6628848.1 hypothetical protein CIPAW_14G040800 [Carya illinoinensis]KAG6677773.1 hypothetical protein I3842_14G043100 [Carya illinoinensis]KAG7946490.1 hypothetical protein I3843_14G041800 [Carya illinoinensis]